MAAGAVLALEGADGVCSLDQDRFGGHSGQPVHGEGELLGVDLPVAPHLQPAPQAQELREHRVGVPATLQLPRFRPRVRVKQVMPLEPPARAQGEPPETVQLGAQPEGVLHFEHFNCRQYGDWHDRRGIDPILEQGGNSYPITTFTVVFRRG